HSYDASLRTRLLYRRLRNRLRYKDQRSTLSLIHFCFFLCFSVLLAGCRTDPAYSARSYDSAWQHIHNGDLKAALAISDLDLKKFPDTSTPDHWRFRTLKAEILMLTRHNEDALALLNTPMPQALATSEMAVWQKLTQGSSFAYLDQYPQSHDALLQAKSVAE